jgi:hypothetical protein
MATSWTVSLTRRGDTRFSSSSEIARPPGANQWVEPMTRSAIPWRVYTALLVMAHPCRSPVTAIDSDREAPQRREGRREDERGMVEISGQRLEPVAFRRRQDGLRTLPSALIPSLRCSLWGVRAALGYGLDQKANQTLETNADSASLRRHRSAFRWAASSVEYES